MSEKTIYTIELHEKLTVHPTLDVMRVAGGWLYTTKSYETGNGTTTTFVPLDYEYQTANEITVATPSYNPSAAPRLAVCLGCGHNGFTTDEMYEGNQPICTKCDTPLDLVGAVN